jgi:DeoR/GlpR family transcriptional regulator of sugar metabolism
MSNNHRLLTHEREARILELLRHSGVLSVAALSRELEVSEATIRRDLQTMHERRLLQRVRGGATLQPRNRAEPLFTDKENQQSEEKARIAAAALDLVEDHDAIYLDGGSTVLMFARLLEDVADLTIVTNSLMAAMNLMGTKHRLVLTGGEFRVLSRTMVGPLTAPIIERVTVDKAFMGTIGFTLAEGMTTTDVGEAFTKEQIMRRAGQVILLADHTKLGVPSFARSGRADEVDILITDKIDADLKQDLEALAVRVIVTDANSEQRRDRATKE